MQHLSWQEQLTHAIRQPKALLEYVGLEADDIGFSKIGIAQFPVRVPHAYADRIQVNNPDDPLLRQVFPYIEEEQEHKGFVHDPLAESTFKTAPGLLHKYDSRVLSITTGACAIHCRYCFRRHFPYQDITITTGNLDNSLAYIRTDTSIKEVILSGGDPLSLSDQRLLTFCKAIAEIAHIKRIRFHTRIPIVLPARISVSLMKKLSQLGKDIVFVLHINHRNEIDEAVINSIRLLQQFNILLLNQSVLLKGVNDDCDTLIELSECLVANQVTPYYLHLLDPVAGAAHYDVSQLEAQALLTKMRARVSGYLVPRLVKEEIGSTGKTVITN